MEINGGSSVPYLACTPCVPLFVHCSALIRVEAEGLLDYQGRAGIISIVRWNLRPVIFGVDHSRLLNPPGNEAFVQAHCTTNFDSRAFPLLREVTSFII